MSDAPPPEHAAIPVWNAEDWFYEDFEPGRKIRSIRRTISEGESMTVDLAWDGRYLPHAWLWQDLNSTAGWPWFGCARVIAIEPSSSPTDGPDRQSAIVIAPNASISISMTLSIRTEGSEYG